MSLSYTDSSLNNWQIGLDGQLVRLQSPSDIYDAGAMLSIVSGTTPITFAIGDWVPTVTSANANTTTATDATNKIILSRDAYIGNGFGRFIENFTNTDSVAKTLTITLTDDIYYNGSTTVTQTSSGDTTFTTADQWYSVGNSFYTTRPNSVHVILGSGSITPITSVLKTGADYLATTFTLTLAPGETKSIMHFYAPTVDTATAVTLGNNIMSLSDSAYLAGLSDTQLSHIANFSFEIFSSVTTTLADKYLTLTLTGIDSISGTGNAKDNVLNGNSADNLLSGLDGNDIIYGNDGNDSLLGGNGNDTLIGGAGNDGFYGDPGNDIIDGGDGWDYLWYENSSAAVGVDLSKTTAQYIGSGNDTDTITGIESIYGSNYGDVLIAGSNGNDLYGAGGNDILYAGAGSDILDGGSGIDTLSYTYASAGVWIDLADPNWQVTGGSGPDNISGFENLWGSNYGDVLRANDSSCGIQAGDGNDFVFAGGGNDVLNGGYGTDMVSYFYASASVSIDLANTALQVTNGSGSDTLTGFENLMGSDFNDTLTGNGGDNLIDGVSGADTMSGGLGNDTYYVDNVGDTVIEANNEGIDIINASVGFSLIGQYVENLNLTGTADINGIGNELANTLTGNSGANTLSGGDGDDTLDGNSGNDFLLGGAGTDVMYGGDGHDTIAGNAGDDTIDGGAGVDGINYYDAVSGVTVKLYVTAAQNTIGAGIDTIINVENLEGSTFNDTLYGNSSGNIISGNDGNDIIDGMGGNDALYGGNGEDTFFSSSSNEYIDGGAGIDTVSYVSATSAVTINLALTVQDTLGSGTDTIINVENLIGSEFNDTLTGDSGNNIITGGAGNDSLSGGAGNDTINGGAGLNTLSGGQGNDTVYGGIDADVINGNMGNDLLYGGAGNDILNGGAGINTIDGGDGIDTVTYFQSTVAVTVNLSLGTTTSTFATDTLINIENIIGGSGDDVLSGNDNVNSINGGAGADTMSGGFGNDTYYVDNVGDKAIELNGGGTDTVNSSVSFSLVGQYTENLTLIGSLNIDATGNAQNNILIGNDFNNTINGGVGDDTIDGGAGNDLLDGGTGIDTLTYITASAGVKVNLGVSTAQDTIGDGIDTIANIENINGSL
ncbi:MAG: calcium-binding protein, partial [Sulfuricurvum sp.]|uniref:beta strand repeat-containing protein n=1 Tax=Sulfuricurvum sp. TaxID=2025608 RepID=UPI002628BD1F